MKTVDYIVVFTLSFVSCSDVGSVNSNTLKLTASRRLKANSHRQATTRHRQVPRGTGELDSRQLKTVADRKFEV